MQYVVARQLNDQVSYLTNSDLWSVNIDNAVSLEEKDAKQIALDYNDLKHYNKDIYDYFIQPIQ